MIPAAMTRVTLIRGDGIGPEVADAVLAILSAAGAPRGFAEGVVGRVAEETGGDPLPPEVLESIRKNRVALKGPVGTPIGKGFPSVNVALRKKLDLYASLRPVRNVPIGSPKARVSGSVAAVRPRFGRPAAIGPRRSSHS